MNLQSPTTLLSSIQFMRSRLRNDKEVLANIKQDFCQMAKKPRPAPIETILEESLRDNYRSNTSLSKEQLCSQRSHRTKLLELKKEHQKELNRIRQDHHQQLQQLKQQAIREREEIENTWRLKLEDQARYISLLEQQVTSPIQTEREKVSSDQYDAVINQLLQENTRLHYQLQEARDEAEKWRKQARQLWTDLENKSRFRLLSKKQQRSPGKRGMEGRIWGNENVDRSNCGSEWWDAQIENDEGKLKTIKQFPKGISQCQVELEES